MRIKTIGSRALALGALACLITGGASALEAQQRGPGRGGPGINLDEQMARLTDQLELTDEQVVSVRQILEMQAERRREAFQGGAGGGDRAAMRAAMAEIQEETAALLAEVLDEEQMRKYEGIQAERRRRPPPLSRF